MLSATMDMIGQTLSWPHMYCIQLLQAVWFFLRESLVWSFKLYMSRVTIPHTLVQSIAVNAEYLLLCPFCKGSVTTRSVTQAHNLIKVQCHAGVPFAGKFGFDQDLQNVGNMQPKAGASLQGSFAQLLLDCSYDVTCNFREILWFARLWRADVRDSWRHYSSYLVRPTDSFAKHAQCIQGFQSCQP